MIDRLRLMVGVNAYLRVFILRICVFVVCALGFGQLTYAHHSHANLNKKDIQRHRGVVTNFAWRMPHVYMRVQAANALGEQVEYIIELLHPPAMLERGWKRDSVKPGDIVSWEGAMDRNPSRHYSGLNWIEKQTGERFDLKLRNTPLEPSSDLSGLWVRDMKGKRPFYAPPEGWPLTDKGKAMVSNFDQTRNPQVNCENPGIPKATILPYPIKISRSSDDRIVFEYELRHGQRIVYLDPGHLAGQASKWGHSVGRMEGDVLVVETDNFISDRWGSHTGIDSSDQKTLVERFKLSDDGLGVEVRMILTDPVYLTKPHEFVHYMRKIQDRELVDPTCSMESAKGFIES